MRYVPSREASRILGVHPQTLRKWAREGRIDYIRTEGNQRRYDVDSYLGQSRPAQTVCYCRVSSKKQSADLDRQVAFMRERYPDAEIVSDVGSGLNFKRKGFLPYWNDYTREISSVLWSPTETVLRGLGPNSSRRCSSATAGSSWFSISETSAPKRSSRLTFSPSSRSSEPASTDCGDTVRKSRR
ncbi:Putative resolvase R771 [Geodia barretti]|uniref:Resolvase R771 n=2 Tax=Geodia barretti TaxID=519541 RepID=A0AA35QWV9_GEOBA|nr:Putative resolvase R771 [Geodia barretti]